jgi:phospholipase/carboxylesterase
MPRTRRSVPPYCPPSPNLTPAFQVDSALCSTGSPDFPYSLFVPQHYEPGYAYPLVVWLHGGGGDERQLQRIMLLMSMRNYVAIAPRGPIMPNADNSQRECFGWLQSDDQIQLAEQRVFDAIEIASDKYNIAPKRIFLLGFSSGGTMAMRLAMSQPTRFAGVASICGAFPTGGKPFGNLIAARRLGIFLATGRASKEYPAERVCDDLRLLHTAGLSITLRQYPCGHELMPQMLTDVDRWIIDEIPPPNPTVESDAEPSYETD